MYTYERRKKGMGLVDSVMTVMVGDCSASLLLLPV